MSLPTQVIAYAIKNTDSAEAAAEMLQEFEQYRHEVIRRNDKIRAIRKDADQKIAALREQVLCPHTVCRTHGDPSGGSDRSVQCLICGDYIEEKPARFT